jgi:hypothetical protein
MTRLAPLLLLLGVSALSGCGGAGSPVAASPVAQAPEVRTLVVNVAYGTLIFSGDIARRDLGEVYEYTVRLTATFSAWQCGAFPICGRSR